MDVGDKDLLKKKRLGAGALDDYSRFRRLGALIGSVPFGWCLNFGR